MTTMRCDDYVAKIDYDADAELFHGRVLNVRDVINFYGASAKELMAEFRRSVEAYLEVCAEEGIEPQKPYSGRFNVRMPPELHRAVVEASTTAGKSLNAWVVDQLSGVVEPSGK